MHCGCQKQILGVIPPFSDLCDDCDHVHLFYNCAITVICDHSAVLCSMFVVDVSVVYFGANIYLHVSQ